MFLNPAWMEADGGIYRTYYGWPQLDLKEAVTPTLGKTVISRSDKCYHSVDTVHTERRGISLYINVRPIVNPLPEVKARKEEL